jgi:predicted Zn-dependent protease
MPPWRAKPYEMSLNRYEQTVFDYLSSHPDERRHWQMKVTEMARHNGQPGEAARQLERELWDYFIERSQHVPSLRDLNIGGVRRVSFLNLAEHLLRLWGPPPKPKKPMAERP